MARWTKALLAGLIGFLTWTLSIHIVPVNPAATSPSLFTCQPDRTNQHVFQSMTDGIVTQMWNDGLVLSVTVSELWTTLSPRSQDMLYQAFGCLAQQKNVAFQILRTWDTKSS